VIGAKAWSILFVCAKAISNRDGLVESETSGRCRWHGYDGISAIKDSSDLATSEILEQFRKASHGDSFGLADIDSAEQDHVRIHSVA
jgi:hypothetical protein